MKCREMNPGKDATVFEHFHDGYPSMKCREMNPGKPSEGNAVGVTGGPSMKCREMNPGKLGDSLRDTLDKRAPQ